MFNTDRLWYMNAVFYEVHVRAYCDSNGDGIGDLNGLVRKLDYIKDLGMDCIWILPMTSPIITTSIRITATLKILNI